MLAINLTVAEMDALEGLPHIVICLYVMAIRPRMDYVTRLVGIRPRISRQALAEWMYVEPILHASTRVSGRPSVQQLRSAELLLKQAGLIQQHLAEKQLIFFLPLARQGKSVSNPGNSLSNSPGNRAKAAPNKALNTPDNSLDNSLGNTHQKQSFKSKPTPTPSLPEGGPVGVELNFDSTSMNPALQQAIEAMLKTEFAAEPKALPEAAQLLLDELTGQGRQREIKNPLAYLRTLIKKMRTGQLVPELAEQIRAGREKKSVFQPKPEKQTVHVRRTPEQLAELRAGLRLARPDGAGKG